MTAPHPAPKPRPESPRTLTQRLAEERAGARGATSALVRDTAGGDPILYEAPEDQ